MIGWVATAPFFLAIVRTAGRPTRAFAAGLVTGSLYFAGTLYWLVQTLVTYGGLSRAAAVPVTGLLVVFLALYPGLVALVLSRAVRIWGARALLLAPCVWVAGEFARGWLFTGFPWVFLGYSQATVAPVVQLASLVGIYGVSWLVALVSATIVYASLAGRRAGVLAGVVTTALVVVATGWGYWRIGRAELIASGTPVRVGVVQGNVAQDQKWDPAFSRDILHRYLVLTREAAASGASFIVWPESSTPFFFEHEPAGRAAIEEVARHTRAWLLLGSDQVERGTPPRYYNAAFLIDPEGRTVGVYRKTHLVPFGEYVPLRSLFFFAAPLIESVSDFSPGTELTLLPVGGHGVTTAICYEAVFPHLARQAVTGGSQLLTTLTNDAWYGWSSAPLQHFEQAAVRAVEQGRYLVRAANTGISGIVDPYGRIVTSARIFEPAVLVAEARFLEPRTLYATIGDSFAWACLGVSVLLALGPLVTGRPTRR